MVEPRLTMTRPQIIHGSVISGGSLPNLAIEGIFTFLFGPKSIRWRRESSRPKKTPSSDVERFCILRSLNSLFWERSYEFVNSLPESKEFRFDVPPLTILQATPVRKLHLRCLKDIGKLDLSSLLTVKDLELRNINGQFSLTPPPNLERLNIDDSNIDMVDLIQGLKETRIIKLEIWGIKDIGKLDLSSLLTVKDLELGDINAHFSLTPPPNLEALKMNNSNIDLIQGVKEMKIIKLEISWLNDIGKLDLSSLLTVKDLELGYIDGHFSLTPPPNLEALKMNNSNIDMVDLIQGLKEMKIIKLEIGGVEVIGKLDLSSLLTVKDLELRNINGHFSLTPPPNLERLEYNDKDINMVGFNHLENWKPARPDYGAVIKAIV